jgi:hypothetical protein
MSEYIHEAGFTLYFWAEWELDHLEPDEDGMVTEYHNLGLVSMHSSDRPLERLTTYDRMQHLTPDEARKLAGALERAADGAEKAARTKTASA